MFCIHIFERNKQKINTAGTPAECYMRATVLHRSVCVYLCCNPGVDIDAIHVQDDRRDERDRSYKLRDTDLQSFTFSFYLYPPFPSLFTKPRFSEAQKVQQVFQALFLLIGPVDPAPCSQPDQSRGLSANPYICTSERLLNVEGELL